MELLDFFKDKFNIDLVIVLLVLGAGFFQKRYLYTPWNRTSKSHDSAIKTLALSSIASTIYVLLLHLQDKTAPIAWVQSFVSYFFATSFYEF